MNLASVFRLSGTPISSALFVRLILYPYALFILDAYFIMNDIPLYKISDYSFYLSFMRYESVETTSN